MLKISAVINTLNEEHNLPYALKSLVEWCDQIIVVDMHSEDMTREIAKSYGADVYLHDRVGLADPARAFALEKATGDWIIMLDADEVVPRSLSDTLIDIAKRDAADVVMIPWRNYIFGKHVSHSGWGGNDDKHARFFKRGAVVSTGVVHNFLHIDSNARVINLRNEELNQIYHFNYLTIHQFIEKMNRYTTSESQILAQKSLKHIFFITALKSFKELFWRYLVKRGYKDGWQGGVLALLMSIYKLLVGFKAIEIKLNISESKVKAEYVEIAQKVVEKYDT